MEYLALKLIHVLSAFFLFGTGLGSAFYMFRADRGGEINAICFAARNVVIADWLFTTPAVVVMPLSGLLMAHRAGYPVLSLWIAGSLALYVLAGLCWLPVVWLQIRMRDMAAAALARGGPLPPRYHRYMCRWFWLGVPAFAAMFAIVCLMVFKPTGW